jgi:hypothetical protein
MEKETEEEDHLESLRKETDPTMRAEPKELHKLCGALHNNIRASIDNKSLCDTINPSEITKRKEIRGN